MKVCAVVPAYNEAGRIGAVLNALHAARSCVHEIIVVDDGSSDGTAEVAENHPSHAEGRLRVVRAPVNRGKGAAMIAGAESAHDAEALIFFDADLIGLTPEHVANLIAPVTSGRAIMALGVFRHGRGATDLAQILVPNISGQRAIRRDVFLSIPCLSESGFGVELAITNYILGEGLPMERVVLPGVTHTMKEEKLGVWRGMLARLRMYRQMLPYILRRRQKHLRSELQRRTRSRRSRDAAQ